MDPYSEASPSDREALGREVGFWNRQPVTDSDELALLVGAQVTTVKPSLNEIGELAGLDIEFDRAHLAVRQFAGDLVVQSSPT